MSKAVLISVCPKWVEKIANGEKTIEVRKTSPKLATPFKCYIYCTFDGIKKMPKNYIAENFERGKVIGEFTCTRVDAIAPANEPYGIYDISDDYVLWTCLANGALWDYGHGTPLYGWHISNLKIYNKPRELGEVIPACRYKNDDGTCPSRRVACSYQRYDYNHDGTINLVECSKKILRPPQSWCYVDEL